MRVPTNSNSTIQYNIRIKYVKKKETTCIIKFLWKSKRSARNCTQKHRAHTKAIIQMNYLEYITNAHRKIIPNLMIYTRTKSRLHKWTIYVILLIHTIREKVHTAQYLSQLHKSCERNPTLIWPHRQQKNYYQRILFHM